MATKETTIQSTFLRYSPISEEAEFLASILYEFKLLLNPRIRLTHSTRFYSRLVNFQFAEVIMNEAIFSYEKKNSHHGEEPSGKKASWNKLYATKHEYTVSQHSIFNLNFQAETQFCSSTPLNGSAVFTSALMAYPGACLQPAAFFLT